MKYEKDHSMTETHCLKNAIILIQTILSFMLSRKIIKMKFLTLPFTKNRKEKKERSKNIIQLQKHF